jgi:hypothetical protein
LLGEKHRRKETTRIERLRKETGRENEKARKRKGGLKERGEDKMVHRR